MVIFTTLAKFSTKFFCKKYLAINKVYLPLVEFMHGLSGDGHHVGRLQLIHSGIVGQRRLHLTSLKIKNLHVVSCTCVHVY